MAELPDEYKNDLINGYFKMVENQKCLKPKFIVEYPRNIAVLLSDSKKNKLSQLWKFYDHARCIQDKINQQGADFEAVEAELNELKPAVNYALNRKTITKEFQYFIDANVSQIKNSDDLAAFIKHFQAVIAYLPRSNQE